MCRIRAFRLSQDDSCLQAIKERVSPDLQITHILSNGTTESHEETLQRLIRLHKLEPELFGELTSNSDLIEKAYDLQEQKMAFRKK